MNESDYTRSDHMARLYGEVVSFSAAARILSRCERTVKDMLEDRRLDYACGGTRVDTRSIARYIESPAQEDAKARNLRAGRKWSV